MSDLFVSALGHTLLHALWQGVVVGLCAYLLQRRLANPWARHASDVLALLALPTLAAITLVLQLMRSDPPISGVQASLVLVDATTSSWSTWVGRFWFVGVAFMAARLLVAAAGLRQIRRRARLADAALAAHVRQLAARLGIHRPVAVASTEEVAVPSIVGLWRPMILLPASVLAGVPPSYLTAVLAHELAHLRRLDPLVVLLQRGVELLFFFHPATWSISRRIDETREHCCDDLVRGQLVDPMVYARALVFFEQARGAAAPLGLSSSGGSFMKRIHRIVHTSSSTELPPRQWLAPLVVMGGLVVTMVAAPACLEAIEDAESEEPSTSADHEARIVASQVQRPAAESLGILWLPAAVESHGPAIIEAALAHGVDPDLLAIVVLVESGGNASVRSPMGARGLMQLMPATAQTLADARGIEAHDESRLDDPAYNLDLGAEFLAEQLQQFGADLSEDEAIRLAAGAYNGGPARMKAHLHDGTPLSEESLRYMKRVTSLWRERNEPESASL